ncbi:hypothetical protein WN51_11682, partial [Melipona quadrifasciata]
PLANIGQRRLIYEVMNVYHKYTSTKFECYRSVGKIVGWQNVHLQISGSMTRKDTLIYELMHAIGFLYVRNGSEIVQ